VSPTRRSALNRYRTTIRWLTTRLESALLIASMAGFVGLLGWIFTGPLGLMWALVLTVLGAAALGRAPTAWLLRANGAQRQLLAQAPGVFRMVEILARRAGLAQLPALYLLPNRAPQAMALGIGDETALAVTEGLLRGLSRREVAGVLAHEVAHLRNGDTRLLGLAQVFAQLTGMAGRLGGVMALLDLILLPAGWLPFPPLAVILFLLAPSLGLLMQLALSRTRELAADLVAAELTGDPRGLASALARLERFQRGALVWLAPWMPRRRVSSPLLQSHPSTEARIRRLLALESARRRRFRRAG